MGWALRLLVVIGLFVSAACSESTASTKMPTLSIDQFDPGEEPRIDLRMSATPGDVQGMVMTVEFTQEDTHFAGAEPVDLVEKWYLTHSVTEVTDGAIHVDALIDSVTMTGAPYYQQQTRAFVGQSAALTVADRAAILNASMPDLTPDDDDPWVDEYHQYYEVTASGAEESLRAISIPVPEDPIGIGASWRVSGDTTFLGIPATMDMTVTVTEITDDRVVAAIESNLDLSEGEAEMLWWDVDVLEGRSEGSGTIVYPLDAGIVPLIDMTEMSTVQLRIDEGLLGEMSFSLVRTTTVRNPSGD